MVTPAARRVVVTFFRDHDGISERGACRLASFSRSSYRRRSLRATADQPLRERLLELAAERPRFGYRRLHVLLRREAWVINRKRVYRVYRELGLAVRRKKRKRVAQANRLPRVVPIAPDIQWSMDFMRDTLASGRVFRTLNVVDDATRECLAIEADTSISGQRTGRVLDAVAAKRGRYPARLVLGDLRDGQRVTLVYSHRGEIRTTQLTVEADPRLELVSAEQLGRRPTPAQQRFRDDWLGSRR